MKVRNLLVVPLSVAALLLTGCGGTETEAAEVAPELQELYDSAREDGTLTWYVSQTPEVSEATIAEFEKAFPGVKVNMLRLAGSELGIRYKQELDAGVVAADLVSIADPFFIQEGAEAGWFAELDSGEMPELDDFPDDFVDSTTVNIGVSPVILAWNTDRVAEADAPATWEDLINADMGAGDMLLPDPRGVPLWLETYDLWLDLYGPDFLRSLDKQGFTLVDSVIPGTEQLAAGAASMMPTVPNAVNTLEGAPIGTAAVEDTNGSEFLTVVSEDAEHSSAAKLFLNFLMSEEGQTAFNAGGSWSPRGPIGDVPGVPEGYEADRVLESVNREQEILSLLGLE